ncbi:unnamed protein product [Urochloa decumbens]|uniref:Jacalin-type lectin domain-containing protein n=1 Tax=Urochloa decumbens TaxID=240449 RepID=A0ABC8VYS3_9POAL
MRIETTKVDLCEGEGGISRDVQVAPYRLLRLTIRSGDTVDGISFIYIGSDGLAHHEGMWGGIGGKEHLIQLGLMDYVKEISGTAGDFHGQHVIRTLKIVTLKRTYGPYGDPGDGARDRAAFHYSVNGSDRITGFFGRSADYMNAIGLYIRLC